MSTSIPISKLNPLSIISGSDFFPLVQSSSLTTFRVDVDTLRNYDHTGSFTGSFYGVLVPFPPTSSYALTAQNAQCSGTIFTFPYWYTIPSNSNLYPTSVLSQITNSIVSIYLSNWYDYTASGLFPVDPVAGGVGGFQSSYPILGQTFVGTDRASYYFQTGSTYWSGSYTYGTIGMSDGSISQNFNGKWIRIAAINNTTENPNPINTASFSKPIIDQTNSLYGKIRLYVFGDNSTLNPPSSNARPEMELDIYEGVNVRNIYARVNFASPYQINLIKAIRIGNGNFVTGSQQYYDPHEYLDILIDELNSFDRSFTIRADSSNGSIRFLSTPTIDPPTLQNTGSLANPTLQYGVLYIPFAKGEYTNVTTAQPSYLIEGYNVGIFPYQYTASVNETPSHLLEVSGSLSALSYSVGIKEGIDSPNLIVYDANLAAYRQITASRGIIVGNNDASSIVYPGTVSSSYAATASVAFTGPCIPKAWALVMGTASLRSFSGLRTMYNPQVMNGYNIDDTIEYGTKNLVKGINGQTDSDFGPWDNWIIKFKTPLLNSNYMVQCGVGGENEEKSHLFTVFPMQKRKTINGFTMSMVYPPARSDTIDDYKTSTGMAFDEYAWFTFTVYSNP